MILSAREHLARESQDEDSLPSSDLSLELNPPYHEVESLLELEPGVQLQTDSIQFIHDKMSELELDIRGLAEKARVRVETLKQLLAGDEHNEILEYRIAGALGVTFEKLWAPDHSTDIEVWSWSDYGNPAAQRSRVNVQDPNISPRTFAVATSRVNGTEELIIVDPDSSWHPGDRVFMYVGGLGPSIGRVRERHGHISVQTMMADRDPRFWDDASWVRDIADRIVGKIIGTARYRVGGLISAIYIFPEVPPREADTWEEYYLARVQDKIARAFNDFDSLFVIMPALKEKPGIREARVALESASQTLAAILAGEGRTLVGSGQVGPHDDDPGAVARG